MLDFYMGIVSVNVITNKQKYINNYIIRWNGRDFNSQYVKNGIYFVKLIEEETKNYSVIIVK